MRTQQPLSVEELNFLMGQLCQTMPFSSDGSEQSLPFTNLHNVSPSEPTHSHNSESTNSPSIKSECSYGPANKGEEPNPGLSKEIQRRLRKHLGKARSPKNISPPHARGNGDRVQRAVRRNAYCFLPQKASKLQAKSPSSIISKLRELSSCNKPCNGRSETNAGGKGEGTQEEDPNSKLVVDELLNMECESGQKC
ncbi:hypothetical protein A4A49_00110 [Nicotiana attenuata]|uniref:Uncharacterized protein n=1 Tax=Nicotiana attenuata TaxID=49451 RepID=A0A1J6I8J2_NICAT|nr:hypothetical protein A4A49_00110 [Nicotiana attenuata]